MTPTRLGWLGLAVGLHLRGEAVRRSPVQASRPFCPDGGLAAPTAQLTTAAPASTARCGGTHCGAQVTGAAPGAAGGRAPRLQAAALTARSSPARLRSTSPTAHPTRG